MKAAIVFCLGLSVLPCSRRVFAAECVPDSAVVCTIDTTTGYPPDGSADCPAGGYQLSTTVQSITAISVVSSGNCQVDPSLAAAALTKLQAEAQQLLNAGVCKAVINNIQ